MVQYSWWTGVALSALVALSVPLQGRAEEPGWDAKRALSCDDPSSRTALLRLDVPSNPSARCASFLG